MAARTTRGSETSPAPPDPLHPVVARLLPVLIAAFAVLLAVTFSFGGYAMVSAVAFLGRAERATATVVAVRTERLPMCHTDSGRRVDAHVPTVRFTPRAGGNVVAEVESSADLRTPLTVGQAVQVAYDPQDPLRVRLGGGLRCEEVDYLLVVGVVGGMGGSWLFKRLVR